MTNVNYYFLLYNHTLYVFRQFDINLQTCMCSVYRDALKKKYSIHSLILYVPAIFPYFQIL